MTCKNCEKNFDCETPCKQMIAWEPLTKEDKIQEKYEAKGIGAAWVNMDGTRPTSFVASKKGL